MNIYYNELRVGHHSHYVMNHSQHEPTLDLYATEAWERMTDGGLKLAPLYEKILRHHYTTERGGFDPFQ